MKATVNCLFIATILFVAAISCSKNDATVQPESRIFYAWTPGGMDGGKVYFDEARMVYWTEADQLSVFRSATNEQYEFDGQTGDDYGTFSKIDASVKGEAYSRNYALYPYLSTANCSSSGLLSFSFPAVQQYAVKSPGLGSSVMVAVTSDSDDNQFRFRNLCGYLMLKITGDVTLREITLEGNGGEVLAGPVTAQIVYLESPSISVDPSGSKTVTLDCSPGVDLNGTIPTEFWLAIPETVFTAGFKISVTTTSEGWFSKSTSNNIHIDRNAIVPMAAFNISKTEVDNQLELPVLDGEVSW